MARGNGAPQGEIQKAIQEAVEVVNKKLKGKYWSKDFGKESKPVRQPASLTSNIIIRVPRDLKEKISREAAKNGLTCSAYARMLLTTRAGRRASA